MKKTQSKIQYLCEHTERVDPKKLMPNPKNPNKHPSRQIDALCGNIERFGWRHPIVVSQRSGLIICGHARQQAAIKLECQAPVDYQDFASAADELAVLMADNIIPELAEMDPELKIEVLEELKIHDVNLEIIGIESPPDQSSTSAGDTAPTPKQDTFTGPTDAERARLDGRTYLVEFSGGIDSSTAVLWLKQFYPEAQVHLLYVDMGADYYGMHDFLFAFAEHVEYELQTLRAPENIIDRFYREGAWPHALHPYCHELLHAALDDEVKKYDANKVVIVRGGRASERSSRTGIKEDRFLSVSRMSTYTYFQPLYFCDKTVGRAELERVGWPIWPGYDTGLGRTACRVCPGQKQGTYATIRTQYPAVWDELMTLQSRLGHGAWSDPIHNNFTGDYNVLADRGDAKNT